MTQISLSATETAIDSAADGKTSAGFWNIRKISPARTLVLCAIGALAGLGIAGYGLFTATGTTTAIYPAEDAAIVNGVPILTVDLIAQLRALYDVPFDQATKEQKSRALNDMIREELYVQRGVELGMPSDDIDVRMALAAAAEAQTVSEEMTNVPEPSALAAYYRQHHERYESEGVMELADWIVPTDDAAQASIIAAKLRAGADPHTLGLTASGKLDDEEQFYFAARIHLGPALYAAATLMDNHSVSAPIAADGQLHLLAMKQNKRPVQASYDHVQARVLADYTEALKQKLLVENTRFLLGRARISIAPALQ